MSIRDFFGKSVSHSDRKPRLRIDYDATVLGHRELAEAIAADLRTAGYRHINVVRDRETQKNNRLLASEGLSESVQEIREICEHHNCRSVQPVETRPFFDEVKEMRIIPYGEADILISINRVR